MVPKIFDLIGINFFQKYLILQHSNTHFFFPNISLSFNNNISIPSLLYLSFFFLCIISFHFSKFLCQTSNVKYFKMEGDFRTEGLCAHRRQSIRPLKLKKTKQLTASGELCALQLKHRIVCFLERMEYFIYLLD